MNLNKTEAPKPKISKETQAAILAISGIVVVIIVLEWALWVITHWPHWSPFVGVNMVLGWIVLFGVGVIMCTIAGEL